MCDIISPINLHWLSWWHVRLQIQKFNVQILAQVKNICVNMDLKWKKPLSEFRIVFNYTKSCRCLETTVIQKIGSKHIQENPMRCS
jgi:hypothetical protein